MAASHVRENALYLNAVTTAFNKRPRWFEYAYCDSSTFRVVSAMKAVSE